MSIASHPPVSEAELLAYVDGQLPSAKLVNVEAWLNSHPEEAERIAAYGRQNDEEC